MVRGADISRAESGLTPENIGFRMKPCALCVVGNSNLRIREFSQFLNGFNVGRAHVGGGDDAELAAAARKPPQLVHDEPQTAPLHE